MQFALGGETLDFVKWSDEPETLVVSSLTPLKPEQVVRTFYDSSAKTVRVIVGDQEAKGVALGYFNINLQLAMELTGYNIVVEMVEQKPPSSEKDSGA